MKTNNTRIAAVTGLLMIGVAGCSRHAAKPTPKPSGTPTPFTIAGQVNNLDATLFDDDGKPVAQVKADVAAVEAGKGPEKASDPIGLASHATATLYQKGKPVATLTADKLHADHDDRVLIGTGNVTVKSLTQPEAPPAIRADTMTWTYKKNLIEGSGHVLVTRGDSIQLPGQSFTADTELKTSTLNGTGETPPTH